MRKARIFTENDAKSILAAYSTGRTIRQIAADYHAGTLAIRKLIISKGGHIKKQYRFSRKYLLDETYFQKIDSSAKCYWLGFLQADGYLSLDRKCVAMTLASMDAEHLRKFLKELDSNYPVRISEASYTYKGIAKKLERCSIEIISEKLLGDLILAGVTPDKTSRATPLEVPMQFKKDYFRGLFDGDGGLSNSKNQWKVYQLSTYEICKSFAKFVSECYPEIPIKEPYRFGTIYKIDYSGVALPQKVVSAIYTDASIYLERKKRQIDILMSQQPKMVRKLRS